MSEVDLLIKELSVRRLNRRGETEMICSKAGEALKKLSVEAAQLAAENEKLRAALNQIIWHCNNEGRSNAIVYDRIVYRCDRIARDVLNTDAFNTLSTALQDKSDE